MKLNYYEQSLEHYQAGRAALERCNLSEAIKNFELSIKVWPHFKTAELLGECLLRTGKPIDAMLYLAAAVGLGNNEFRASYLLAKACIENGEKVEAYEYLKQAIDMNPQYKMAKELFAELSKDKEIQAMLVCEEAR